MFYIYFRHSGIRYLLATAKNADNAAMLMVGLASAMGRDWHDFHITDKED